jgi:hypothetical protein
MSNKIAQEIERENEEIQAALFSPPPVNTSPVKAAKVVWIAGVILLDVATSYFVWQTTILLYGVIWFLVGAAGLSYSEWMRERVGNNPVQEKIGKLGVAVSAIMVLIAAIGMGAVYLLGLTNQRAVMLSVEVVTVLLFSYHLIQSYRYHVEDDEYKEKNTDARLEARNVSHLRQIRRAAARVKNTESLEAEKDRHRAKNPAAFDAAYLGAPKETEIDRGNGHRKQGEVPAQDFTDPAP